MEYTMTAKGLAEQIAVVKSTASKSLQESAMRLLRGVRCKPTKEWINGGGPQRRLRLNVVFQFFNESPVKPIDSNSEVVSISALAAPASRKQ